MTAPTPGLHVTEEPVTVVLTLTATALEGYRFLQSIQDSEFTEQIHCSWRWGTFPAVVDGLANLE